MCFSTMTMTSEEIRNAIFARDAQERMPLHDSIECTVRSTPNGQHYGINGHIPCTHTLIVVYQSGAVKRIVRFGPPEREIVQEIVVTAVS